MILLELLLRSEPIGDTVGKWLGIIIGIVLLFSAFALGGRIWAYFTKSNSTKESRPKISNDTSVLPRVGRSSNVNVMKLLDYALHEDRFRGVNIKTQNSKMEAMILLGSAVALALTTISGKGSADDNVIARKLVPELVSRIRAGGHTIDEKMLNDLVYDRFTEYGRSFKNMIADDGDSTQLPLDIAKITGLDFMVAMRLYGDFIDILASTKEYIES